MPKPAFWRCRSSLGWMMAPSSRHSPSSPALPPGERPAAQWLGALWRLAWSMDGKGSMIGKAISGHSVPLEGSAAALKRNSAAPCAATSWSRYSAEGTTWLFPPEEPDRYCKAAYCPSSHYKEVRPYSTNPLSLYGNYSKRIAQMR